MRARFQFIRAAALLAAFAVLPLAVRADQAPASAVGQVVGTDVSVEGGAGAQDQAPVTAPTIYVSSGSVVTVHSGHARMTLFAGGRVDICGPAKFTLLQSNGAVTLALNFGRVRAEVPATTSLRIFTPTIVATPIEISGGARDVSVGLSLDDSLCVLASSGAIRLEHQFSGEKLIVPQAGEFFLGSGKLVPVAGTPGSCQCLVSDPEITPAPPAIPELAGAATPAAPEEKPQMVTAVEEGPIAAFSVPANANEAHPVVKQGNVAMVEPPQVRTTATPVLVFSASAPVPPADPTPDFTLLVHEARLQPDWEFTGQVAAPEFVRDMKQALGENKVAPAATPQQEAAGSAPAEQAKKKKGGFWASLRRAFGAGEPN